MRCAERTVSRRHGVRVARGVWNREVVEELGRAMGRLESRKLAEGQTHGAPTLGFLLGILELMVGNDKPKQDKVNAMQIACSKLLVRVFGDC